MYGFRLCGFRGKPFDLSEDNRNSFQNLQAATVESSYEREEEGDCEE